MKRTIIISSYDNIKNPYYAGGGADAVHKLGKHLTKKYEVKVLTGKYPRYKDKKIDGVVYKHVGASFGGPKVGQLSFFASLPFSVLNEKFDLWIESFTPPFSTAVLPLFTKKPVIGLVHMLTGADMERKYKLPFSKVEGIGLRVYKYFIVTTKETKEKILSQNKNCNITIIPNGIDIPTSYKKKKPKHILFIGRIEINQKGLDLLVKAYKKVENNISYPLIIAGSGEKKQVTDLSHMIRKLDLSEKVKLVGYVKNEKKKNLLEEAAFVVIPSRFETFCMVVLDAFLYGLPVLSYNIDGLTWVPKNYSMKVKPFSITALSTGLKKLSYDTVSRDKKMKGVTEYIKQYRWDSVLRDYEKCIDGIFSNII